MGSAKLGVKFKGMRWEWEILGQLCSSDGLELVLTDLSMELRLPLVRPFLA